MEWSSQKGARAASVNATTLPVAITVDQYKDFIARMVGKTIDRPVPDDLKVPLQEVLNDFRANPLNHAYRSIQEITHTLKEIRTVPERPMSIDLAEQAYALAIISLASSSEADKIKGQRELKDVQHQLALMYADNDIFIREARGQQFSPADRKAKEETYQALLNGTLSTYLVNKLKDKELIPQTTKLGGLGL